MPNESLQRDTSAMDIYKNEDFLELTPLTHIKGEQVSSDESQIKPKPKTRRHRASVACTSCRDRRIRCVMPSGKKVCTQCERSNASCIIKDDDERRRPISRAYVESLVERVALLERILKEQGLTVPPANHPPETRYPSRRRKDIPSVKTAPSLSSTLQESSTSEDYTASSPCSSDDPIRLERRILNNKKRSLMPFNTDVVIPNVNKRVRHDSLIAPVDVKVESPVYNHTSAFTHYDTPYGLDQLATILPSDLTPLWPTTYDHRNGQATIRPIPEGTKAVCNAHSAWSNNTCDFHVYDNHALTAQYGEALHTGHQYDAASTPKSGSTNLDFMTLITSS